ncbi:MAG: carbohydrate ABC transporter permease, partial [Clostridiales bacterium]|nr:carbohydrate ABC transporter permease [Clostridiales bacterium]
MIFTKNQSLGDTVFSVAVYFVLGLIAAIVLYPLIYIFSSSFSSPNAVIQGRVWLWPVDISFEGYRAVFASKNIWSGYGNTIFYAVVGTSVNVSMTLIAAYPLSRSDFKARNAVMLLFAFTMFFGGGMIPSYLLVKDLGLINTRAAMIVPGAMSVWNVIITRTYYQSDIPSELWEVAQIDGCSHTLFFTRVVLPLSKAIIAINILFYSVGHWNDFMGALLYINESSKYPLQLILREILIQNQIDSNITNNVADIEYRSRIQALLKYSVIVVSSLPVLAAYPFVQKYFVR